MNMTIEFITPSVNLNAGNETTVIGPSTSDDLHVIQLKRHKIDTSKQKDKKESKADKRKDKKESKADKRKDKKEKQKRKKQRKKEKKAKDKLADNVSNTTPDDKQFVTTDISKTTPTSVDFYSPSTSDIRQTNSISVDFDTASITNLGIRSTATSASVKLDTTPTKETVSETSLSEDLHTVLTTLDTSSVSPINIDTVSTTQKSVNMNNIPPDSADVLTRGTMINNQGVKIVSPEFIRKLQESLQAKVDKIRQLGNSIKSNATTPSTKPMETTVNSLTTATFKPQTNGTTTSQNIVSTTKNQETTFSKTTEPTTQTTIHYVVNISPVQNSTGKISTTVSHIETTTLSNDGITGNTLISKIEKTTQSHKHDPIDHDDIKTPPDLDKSGLVIIKENEDKNSNSTDTVIKDIDIIIFPSSRADFKKRKKERKKYCRSIDFGTAARGFQCCKKTLNCFDEVPHQLDDTVFHHANPDFNEAERIHLCHDVEKAFECLGQVLQKTGCQEVAPIMDEKLKPQLDKVKLFYYNTCNRATSLGPVPVPNPTSPSIPVNTTGSGTEGYHTHTSSFAPFLGGAIMGVFGLIVLIIFAIYCRNRVNKRKRRKQKREDQSRASSESSRYVSYNNRRKSDVYAEIDEKSMITTVSYVIDGTSNDGSCVSRSAPSLKKLDVDNHGYLSPRGSLPEDDIKADIQTTDLNLFTHGYIELKSENGESAQSYAKLEREPEDDYIQADKIESMPDRTSKKSDEQGHMYFILEKDKEQNKNIDGVSKDN